MQSTLQAWLTAFSAVFFIVDPFAAIPTFLVLTSGDERAYRKRMAARAARTCFLVLTAFALAGKYLFRVFGITLPAFKLAGGLLLLLVALEMLQARRSRTKEAPEDRADAAEKDDIGAIPMGIPMLAGPGSISAVMVLVGQSRNWVEATAVFVSIAVTSLTSYFVLGAADRVGSVFGDTGIRVLTRIMGLMLTAIAFQFALSALTDLGVVSRIAVP